jgi:N-formylglutamate deformylase
MTDWLHITRGDAPLVVAFPHTGTDIPNAIAERFRSTWLARKDADWWIDRLYDFATELGATTIRTTISRAVIDVNRDPSGVSLYPGQATTGLCPIESFDGEPLYLPGVEPEEDEIAERRGLWFDPYHAAVAAELARLEVQHKKVVLYDAHSIRSVVPRLFAGELPQFNIGTFDGATCAPELTDAVAARAAKSGHSHVVNGRFKGGWTTRRYGYPVTGIHAIQMELACRGYMADPAGAIDDSNWPSPYDSDLAAPLRTILHDMLTASIAFAKGSS